MDSELIWDILLCITTVTSLISCVWFQITHYKLPKKSLALKMIAILSLGNLVFHLVELIGYFLPDNGRDDDPLSLTYNAALLFTIIWSPCIAFLVSNSVSKDRMNDPGQYLKWSLIVILSLSCLISLAWTIWTLKSHQAVYEVLAYPFILSSIATFCFYLTSLNSIKKYPIQLQGHMNVALQRLFLYPSAQLFITTPTLLCIQIGWYLNIHFTYTEDNVLELPLSLFGTLNALICYLQQRSASDKLLKSTMIIEDFAQNKANSNEEEESVDSDYRDI